MGPDLQLAVRLDWDWMADCTIYCRQEINSKADRNQEPQAFFQIKFYKVIGSKGQTAVYKWYIRFVICDKNPSLFPN